MIQTTASFMMDKIFIIENCGKSSKKSRSQQAQSWSSFSGSVTVVSAEANQAGGGMGDGGKFGFVFMVKCVFTHQVSSEWQFLGLLFGYFCFDPSASG